MNYLLVNVVFITFQIAVFGNEDKLAPICPHVDVVKNFNVTAYLGRWYEIERIPVRFQPFGACVTATYSKVEGKATIKVVNRQINDNTSLVDEIEGSARLADTSGDARLLVSFPVSRGEGNYWVLATDYEHYSVVYSCSERDGVRAEMSWILSRKPKICEETRRKINNALAHNHLRLNFVATRQDGSCKYE